MQICRPNQRLGLAAQDVRFQTAVQVQSQLFLRAGRRTEGGGQGWTEVLEIEDENGRARLAAAILASPAYQTTIERVRAFVQQGGGCRATFFNHRRRLGNGLDQKPAKA
jgi:hypothetical protein